MKRIYRVENKEGDGPYTSFDAPFEVYYLTSKHYDELHPGPYQEGWGRISSDCLFGFKDLEQLKKWFTYDERQILSKYGWRIAIYYTKRLVKNSNKQCIFKKETARRVTAFNLMKGKK